MELLSDAFSVEIGNEKGKIRIAHCIMMIDAHQHVFWQGTDDAGLIADMDSHGIDQAWLLTWETSREENQPSHLRKFNPAHALPGGGHKGMVLSDVLLAAGRYPDRFVIGYCPHPAGGAAASLFEAAWHMHSVRVCGEWKFRMLLDDPRCLELFRAAGRLGAPVVCHIDCPYLPDRSGNPV